MKTVKEGASGTAPNGKKSVILEGRGNVKMAAKPCAWRSFLGWLCCFLSCVDHHGGSMI